MNDKKEPNDRKNKTKAREIPVEKVAKKSTEKKLTKADKDAIRTQDLKNNIFLMLRNSRIESAQAIRHLGEGNLEDLEKTLNGIDGALSTVHKNLDELVKLNKSRG